MKQQQHDSKSFSPENKPVLQADSVTVEYSTDEGPVQAIRDVSAHVEKGETLGIAGESGSGKSTLAYAILQILDDNGSVTSGTINFKGRSIEQMSSEELQSIRGRQIAHVPQDPRTSLNPGIRVGEQIAETIRFNLDATKSEAHRRTIEMLDKVNISDAEYNAKRYPHELSGGMQQRILVAMALSCDPEVLILDEPTTGLDVTTQANILDLIKELKSEMDTSILLITHNLSVISDIADRVNILYAGEILEKGTTREVFESPSNPYTQGLLAALPSTTENKELVSIPGQIPDLVDIPGGCIFADRCEFATEECRSEDIELEDIPDVSDHQVRCRRWEVARKDPIKAKSRNASPSHINQESKIIETENVKKFYDLPSFFDRLLRNGNPVKAVNGVDIDISEGETVGLVGESGCGKSTLGRLILGLTDLTEGKVSYMGDSISELNGNELKKFRSESQIVFQNPRSSLNPQKTVKNEILRPVQKFTDLDESERERRVIDLLEQVELGPEYQDRHPHELSGGEQQRVAIARAFAADPSFVVLDEPVSALDVSVQASILSLLERLRREYNSSYLFISHNLGVVKHISDRIAVMYLGRVVETGSNSDIFNPPFHPYTRALISSVPSIDPIKDKKRIELEGELPSARDPPSGCPFQSRCPQKIGDVCENEVPELEEVENSCDDAHQIACHLDYEDMNKETKELATQSMTKE